ncbi:MAG: iron ABC transporter ATP-binding protein [Dehalococcoides mccartyi]|uniref:ABC transporter ATP-binding protein n=1 Tax=Dehalococcoides mccartyi TaxID=61435 RepID=UPI002430C332|nr:ABC transporter ATP-binding protein [Dehalococcoides mccartyi]MCF7635291.1 iron ABC transporter ATP-binding protein [Dehalococcoides mccartyi]MEA2122212.1 Petrobactin import ATP-binding protein FpuC [Dehalococcoides mccartyi]
MKLDIQGIRFNYGSVPILKDVSLGIGKGEILSLAGPNGSGKTTLLRCINRILKPHTGTVMVDDNDLSQVGLKELAHFLGYVPQSAPTSFPLTVFDTVLLGRKPHVHWKLSEKDKDLAFQVLERMDLECYALRLFNELSGGEKQKVLIARAICQEPQILVLDEPTSNLDLKHQLEVLSLISNLVKEQGLSAVMAVHDLNLASRYSSKIAMLKKGQIYAAGEPDEVLNTDSIREVYGVETEIGYSRGRPFIIPIAPISTRSESRELAEVR